MDYFFVLLHVALIWMLAVMTPGANVLLTINTALHYERRLAMFSALGVSSATLLWAFFGGSGLVILFSYFPQLLSVMKVVGGGYLVYLGIRQIYLTRKHNRLGGLGENQQYAAPSSRKIYLAAFVTSILNPKTGFFVVSLFSVSMPENMGPMLVLAIMLTMSSITLVWHLLLAVAFSHRRAKTTYASISNTIDYVTGGLFTLLGIKVISS